MFVEDFVISFYFIFITIPGEKERERKKDGGLSNNYTRLCLLYIQLDNQSLCDCSDNLPTASSGPHYISHLESAKFQLTNINYNSFQD